MIKPPIICIPAKITSHPFPVPPLYIAYSTTQAIVSTGSGPGVFYQENWSFAVLVLRNWKDVRDVSELRDQSQSLCGK